MSPKRVLRLFAAILSLSFSFVSASAARAGGIGILGDSYSDEYQFYPPHRASARNWVEILAATRDLDFGEFSTASRPEPRNAGFAFNWSRSGATSGDMIASGQHLGLADQVRRKEVEIAIVFIGGNDFIEALHTSQPRTALTGQGLRAASNVKEALAALEAASPLVKIVVVTVPDLRELPEMREAVRSGAMPRELVDLSTAELARFNGELRKLAKPGRVAVLDFARISRASNLLAPEAIPVGGVRVQRNRTADAMDALFLEDVRHLGTLGQGLFARMIVETLNMRFGSGIRSIEDREIVALASAMSGDRRVTSLPAAETNPAAAPGRGTSNGSTNQDR